MADKRGDPRGGRPVRCIPNSLYAPPLMLYQHHIMASRDEQHTLRSDKALSTTPIGPPSATPLAHSLTNGTVGRTVKGGGPPGMYTSTSHHH
ncbi:hypothetical protein BDZ94DRAFT_1264337 [Collybia nuda]|uniref:Uncharacterized protein n=1 Tax=Collybia nuda TaxID=64659 RepID=A0A9P5Y4P3_9AGAR|nr:hypothetical protein BDZ94DRAFT_1264337 [Collybia nuda]